MDLVATQLEGAALSWINALLAEIHQGKRAPFGSWEAFSTLFVQTFEPTTDQELARQQLKVLRQTGRVAGYLQRFRELRYRLPTMTSEEAYSAFIDSLNPTLRAQIGALTHGDLDAAMLMAERMNLFQASSGGAGTSAGTDRKSVV